MSQPRAQQATKNKRTISVVTIKFSITTETTKESKRYFLRHRKLGRDREDKLKEENFCHDRENYVAIEPRRWLQIDFFVATQGNHVATQIRLLHHSSVAILSKFVPTKLK